ncbi:MAG: hypothetical protein OEM91_15580 [Hyphomicrobiales bacterium]|nr:hypothetical protein [Hyphomicrobiales bacterium]
MTEQNVHFDPEKEQQEAKLKTLGGSEFDVFNSLLCNQALHSLWLCHMDDEQVEGQRRAVLCGMEGIAPRDELEGMLAVQMLACHNAAMECHRRAMNPEATIESRNYNLTQANRLSRTYTALLEALNRHRGKGQQKMTVEHVHVHEGGQAIVGSVSQGGGSVEKGKEQPDAQAIPNAPQPEMRREDAQRETVPGTGDEER